MPGFCKSNNCKITVSVKLVLRKVNILQRKHFTTVVVLEH